MREFTITFVIDDESKHEPEVIFDLVQMMCYDDFGGEVDCFYGKNDELISGDSPAFDMAKEMLDDLDAPTDEGK